MSDFYNSTANESFVEGDLTVEGEVIADNFVLSSGAPIGGGIAGPPTSTVGFVPVWNNATGSELAAGLDPATLGGGDVSGPGVPVTDNRLVLWDGITGTDVKEGTVTEADLVKKSDVNQSIVSTAGIVSITSSGGTASLTSNGGGVTVLSNGGIAAFGSLTDPVFVQAAGGNPISIAAAASDINLNSNKTTVQTRLEVGTAPNQVVVDGATGKVEAPGGIDKLSSLTGTVSVNTNDPSAAGQVLQTTSTTSAEWVTPPSGDVVGPATSTDTAIALYDGTTGTLLKDSTVTVDAAGDVTANRITCTSTDDANISGSGAIKTEGGVYCKKNIWSNGGLINGIPISTIVQKAIAPNANTDGYIPTWNGTNSKTLNDGLDPTKLVRTDVPQQEIINPDIRFITPGDSIPQFVENTPVFVDANATSTVCISSDSLWVAITVSGNQVWIYSRPDIYVPFTKFDDVTLINSTGGMAMSSDGSQIALRSGGSTQQFLQRSGASYSQIGGVFTEDSTNTTPYITGDGLFAFFLYSASGITEKVTIFSRSGSTWSSLGSLTPNTPGTSGASNRGMATNLDGSVIAWETNNVIEVWRKTGSSGLIGDWTYDVDLPNSSQNFQINAVNTVGDRIMGTNADPVLNIGPRSWIFSGGSWSVEASQPDPFLKSTSRLNDVTPDGLILLSNVEYDPFVNGSWVGTRSPFNFVRTYRSMIGNQVTNDTIILVPDGTGPFGTTGEFVAITIQTTPLVINGGTTISGNSNVLGDFDISGALTVGGTTLGDVSGPATSTDTAIALYDGTTGTLLKDSTVTVDGTGNVTAGTYNNAVLSELGLNNLFVNTNLNLSLTGIRNTFINAQAVNSATTAQDNVIVGTENAMALTTGRDNVVVGYRAGSTLSTATDNVFIGERAGLLSNGLQNVYIGTNSGERSTFQQNVCIGFEAGQSGLVTTGFGNSVMIGSGTGTDVAQPEQVIIGHNARSNGRNTIVLGNAAVGTAGNQCMIGDQFITEIVPNASATCNLGSATNPFSNLTLDNTSVVTINTVVQDTKDDAYGFIAQTPAIATGTPTPETVTLGLAGALTQLPTITGGTGTTTGFNMTAATQSLTIVEAGTYEVSYSISAEPQVDNEWFSYYVRNGGVPLDNTVSFQFRLNGRSEGVSKTTIQTLGVGDVLTIAVACSAAGEDVDIVQWCLSAKRLRENDV